MRPVAITFVSFMYLCSLGFFLAEVLVLAPIGMVPTGLQGETFSPSEFIAENADDFRNAGNITFDNNDGNILEQISGFTQTSYDAVLKLLSLLSGTYFFSFLTLLGIPDVFILALQLIFGVLVVSTVVYYLTGRG